MPSDQKIQANRRNAQRSTGPKTPEGKATVSRNATRHGLASSRTVVLPEENRQEFEELVDAFRSEYQPQGPLERFLVLQSLYPLQVLRGCFRKALSQPCSAETHPGPEPVSRGGLFYCLNRRYTRRRK